VLKEAGRLALSCRADRVAIESWLALANLNGQRRRLDVALEWSTMAEALLARDGDPKLELKRLHTLAEVYRLNGKPKDEIESARRAVSLAERLSPPDDLELGIGLYDLGAALSTNGESPVEAEALLRRALDVYARHPNELQREQDRALTGLGVVLTAQHRYAEAAEIARRTLALDEQLFPPGHPWLAYSLTNLCDNLAKLERFDEAAAALEQATPIVQQHALADLAPQLPILRAIIDAGRGHGDASVAAALESALALPALAGADRAEVQMALARVSWQRGERRRALGLATQARSVLEKDSPRDDTSIARIASWMAKHGS
jgi:tetratricopeptide (TPR) repeat protein